MAAASMRHQKRSSLRRIAAKNFLSNISLDGSHTDTNYSIHIWKRHKHKNDEPPHGVQTSFDANVSESDYPPELNRSVSSYESQNVSKDISSLSVGSPPRPRAKTMYQITKPHSSDDGNLDKDRAQEKALTPSKRWRASSYSEKDRSCRRRLVQLQMENVPPSIRENVEKIDRSSRRSSSLSGDSNESHDHEVRFLSPESRRKIKNERLLIVSSRKVPFVISSTLPYIKHTIGLSHDIHELPPVRSRHHSGTRSISSQEDMFLLGQKITRGDDGQDISYCELLEPSKKKELKRTVSETKLTAAENHSSRLYARSNSEGFSTSTSRVYTRSISDDPKLLSARASIANFSLERVPEEDEEDPYDPNLLDDPELQSGGYRTVLNFSSYMTSVIDYVKPSTLKKELNEKFKERFPSIQLSLTKFRSLKKEMRSIGHVKCSVDLWIVAQAYVFFEKLILKLLITKQNRKLCAGACLMLSAKLNDMKGAELKDLIDEIEDDFRLHRKEMLSYEFATLVALEFSLHITDSDIYPHYQRLLYQS